MKASLRGWITWTFAAVCILLCTESLAQSVVLSELHTVAAADHAVPVEHDFSIGAAGTYQVTLVDLGAQLTPAAPLASVKLAITDGSSIVGEPLPAAGSMTFTATAGGTYTLHIVGTPGTVAGSGPIGVQISDSGGTKIFAFSDTLALPAGTPQVTTTVLDDSFTAAANGDFQVSLTDLQLPANLGTLTLLLTAEGASTPVVILPDTAHGNAMQATVTLQSGVNYRIFAIGQAGAGAGGGLFSVAVTPIAGGTPAYPAKILSAGAVSLVASQALTAGNYQFVLSDLGLPAALTQLSGVVTSNGQVAAQLPNAGSVGFAATAGVYQVFVYGVGGTSGMGSYGATLQPASGPAALSVARAVTTPGGAAVGFSYDGSVAGGSYSLNLADFGFPNPFTSISAAAIQNSAVLGEPLLSAGTKTVTPVAGPVSVLVFATAASAGGLYGVDLTPADGSAAVIATTQGVGQLFSARKFSITASGNYGVNVTDLLFPTRFASFAAIVTRGTQSIGSIFGGGTFTFAATPGNYFVNFVAQPSGSDAAGTYSLSVGPPPAAPTVTLTSDVANITSGGTVSLAWTSQDATSCVASDGWSGTQSLNGTVKSPALTVTTKFTLTCTGVGGSTAKSVQVAVSPPASGGGGGGLFDGVSLFAMLVLSLVRVLGNSRAVVSDRGGVR